MLGVDSGDLVCVQTVDVYIIPNIAPPVFILQA